ncbi:hypothetical protein [uncultured Cetobacterium sp.]|uniref:lysine 5,6-aminomutase reactivase subunit KamB n=1 Tax=uncultured Cetobacterium sp. TaxID=527638 RepID=UPI00263920FD|nr:hypothetical protein [uncultured Cetobacterium sp.]
MPFINEIKKYRSIATIGLEKNVGKTETMNYILKRLKNIGVVVGTTSIGIDGEITDIVTATSKPEVTIFEGMLFATSEKHYKKKKFQAEILGVSEQSTALGRLVIARAIGEGTVLLSGPSNSSWVKKVIDEILEKGVDTVIVDGALSRLSVGSPIITEGIVLSTGAAISLNLNEIVKKTRHIIELLKLDSLENEKRNKLLNLEDGIYKVIWEKEIIEKLPIKSILNFSQLEKNIFEERCSLYITGVLTERFIDNLSKQSFVKYLEIIVKDFTKIFVSQEVLNKFFKRGGFLKVLFSTKLIAITINPIAPTGHILNSKELIKAIEKFTDIPVVNLREETDV